MAYTLVRDWGRHRLHRVTADPPVTASVVPVRVRFHVPEWSVYVLRGIGFQGRCDGCWKGSIRKTRPHALDDVRRHRRESHQGD